MIHNVLTNIMTDIYIIIAIVVSFLLEIYTLPHIIYIAKRKQLYDTPNQRKSHKNLTPRLGGVTFFPIILFVLALLITVFYQLNNNFYDAQGATLPTHILGLTTAGVLIWFVGIQDDLVGVRYREKFVIQFMSAAIVVFGGCWINDFNGIFGIYGVPLYVSIPFTMLTIVFIMNSVNLIDGADGLASGISVIAVIALGILHYFRGDMIPVVICGSILGLLLPFFYYNVFLVKKKIFMGDTGSLTLGLYLGYLVVSYAMNSDDLEYLDRSSPTIMALSCLFIPIMDALRVVVVRLSKHQSPFYPDKQHIHHKLFDLGFSHKKVMIFLVFAAGFFIILNYFLIQFINNTIVLFVDLLIWLLIIKGLNMLILKRKINK